MRCFDVVIYSQLFIHIAQDCPGVSETELDDMGKIGWYLITTKDKKE